MRSRGPIYALLAAGFVIIGVLTFVPYSVMRQAGDAVASLMPGAAREAVLAPPAPPPPPFDVVSFYAERGADLSRHGVLVESLDGTRVYASHNPDQAFNPASLIKLATSLAVLRRLGAEHRFETRVYADGQRDERTRTLRGRVVIAGSDPVFGDSQAALVARELRARGVERLDGELLVTPGFSFNFAEKPEDSAARAAKVMQLKERATGVADAEPAGQQPLFVVKSQTLREILLYMNAHSNNFVAERLGALVGGPEGVRAFLVEELRLPAEQVVIQRASGREHNRMTARGVLAVIRALREECERQGLRLEDLMPVASDDSGTLRRRLEGTPLEGATLGKTGTLTAEVDGGMASLAGVVYTQPSGAVVFAIFNQGSHIAENREMEDILLAQVVAAQETPRPIHETEERRRLLSPASLIVEPEALGNEIELPEPTKTDEPAAAPRGEERASRRKAEPEPKRARNARGRTDTANRRTRSAPARRRR